MTTSQPRRTFDDYLAYAVYTVTVIALSYFGAHVLVSLM